MKLSDLIQETEPTEQQLRNRKLAVDFFKKQAEMQNPAVAFMDEYESWYAQQPIFKGNSFIELGAERHRLIKIDQINIDPQGTGAGTKIMNELMALAARHKMSIELEAYVDDEDTEDQQRLVSWYERLGFYLTGDENMGPIMRWDPKV